MIESDGNTTYLEELESTDQNILQEPCNHIRVTFEALSNQDTTHPEKDATTQPQIQPRWKYVTDSSTQPQIQPSLVAHYRGNYRLPPITYRIPRF
jgi:hypothetical protein